MYLSEVAKTMDTGFLNKLGLAEAPGWKNGAIPWEDQTTPASDDSRASQRSEHLSKISSRPKSRITESPAIRSLHVCIQRVGNTGMWSGWTNIKYLSFSKYYLPQRGMPPLADTIGAVKAPRAFFTALVSEKVLPHNMSDELSISTAAHPWDAWASRPRVSPTLELRYQGGKCKPGSIPMESNSITIIARIIVFRSCYLHYPVPHVSKISGDS